MNNDDIKSMIEQGIPGARVQVDGDGTHFQAIVISDQFEGAGMVKRHQQVYACLGDKVGNDIHALSIQAYTHPEWERQKPFAVINH